MNKMKSRIAQVIILAMAFLGLGALSTPASAYSLQGCLAPKTVSKILPYYVKQEQKCYVNYNWYEEIYSSKKDGYKVAYSWNLNTVTKAKSNFRTHNLKYA